MKKFTTHFSLIIGLFLASFGLLAQESNSTENKTKNKQFGLRFYNIDFDNFGIQYKSGKGKSKFRLNAASLLGSKFDGEGDVNYNSKRTGIGFGVTAGFEKHKNIDDKFDIYHGFDFGLSYDNYKYEVEERDDLDNTIIEKRANKSDNKSISVGVVLGAEYFFNKKISLSAELVPTIRYSKSKNEYEIITETIENKSENTSENFTFRMNNNTAALTLSYHF